MVEAADGQREERSSLDEDAGTLTQSTGLGILGLDWYTTGTLEGL